MGEAKRRGNGTNRYKERRKQEEWVAWSRAVGRAMYPADRRRTAEFTGVLGALSVIYEGVFLGSLTSCVSRCLK